MDSTAVATAVKLWASMHKDYINFENIDEAGYCITLSVSAQKHQFQIFCQQDSWKPMFVVSEDPALNDWVTTINKYIQMFTNGVNIEQFVAELEKTLTKIFPKTAAVPTEPNVTVSAPSFKLPDNILPNVEVVSQSTADKIKPNLTVPGTNTANAAIGVSSEIKPQQLEENNGKDMDSVRSQIMKWIGENTYVNVTLESIQSSFQVELSIGFPKIKFQILFTNEWKPMIIMSDSPFLSDYLAPANIMIEDRMQSGEPMQLSELMNMFALAYNEGQQQFQEQLNMDNKPMVDIPNIEINTDPIVGDPTEVVPPPPEPDVPPEIPTEQDWIMTIFPSIRRHLETDNFQPWEVEEWVRRVDKARHTSNDEGVRLIRSEILGGAAAPPEINRFIPKWRYLFGPNANANANNATEEDPNNIRYKYNTKDGSEEATKRLIEEIQQLTALGDTKATLGFVAKPIGKNLFQWSVILSGFKADSVLGQDLIEYSLKHRSQKSLDEGTLIEPSDIVFEVKFPADYPHSPPLFRLIRPRLIVPDNVDFGFAPSASTNNNNNVPSANQPTTNATTFSEFERQKAALNKGKHPLSMSIQIERHSSNAWNPQLHIVDLVQRIRNVLETGNIRVDNMMSTKEGLPTVGSFWKTYRCISSKNIGRGDADQGGKIFLPTSCVELLYGENDTPSWRGGFRHMDDGSDDEDSMDVDNVPNGPMVFEISSRSGKRSFVGVLEFTAPEGYAALPTWMMENLMVKESDPLQIRRVKLPRGQFLKLQPHSDKFYEVGNAKAMLEWVLRGFNALAVGDTIHVNHDNKEYKFDVLHVEPGQAIAITDSDLKVDFAEPLEGSKDTGKSSFAADKPKTNKNPGVSMSTELHRDGLLSSVEMNRYDEEEDKENKKKAAVKDAVGAASGRLETADTDVEGVNYKVCETCRQKIPMASFNMHSISCPRINWFCEKCHTVVKKTERQSHLDTAHAVITCPDCKERVEQFQFEEHKKDKCPMRPVHCQYCELKIRLKDRYDHENSCGSVTEVCEKCKRRVPRRELAVHESACDGSGVLSSSPSMSSGFTFGSPATKFTPPPFQRKNSVYLCEKCQHPCEGFDELQVHMLTVHSDDNMVDIIPESFEDKEKEEKEEKEQDKETMQM